MNYKHITASTIGELESIRLNHPKFTAEVCLFGGQLLSFAPKAHGEVLWLSNTAILDGSKPIRGGVPICWPWFGPALGVNAGKAQHGYARAVDWRVESVIESPEKVEVVLAPNFSEQLSKEIGLTLKARFLFSESVEIQLVSENNGSASRPLSQAIHSYFNVADIDNTQLTGLEGTDYFDQLTRENKKQQGEISIEQACDRIYYTKTAEVELISSLRSLKIEGCGHESIVVWNPWQQGAKNMADFDDTGFKQMLCVEMANTRDLVIAPGETHLLSQKISIQ